MRHLAAGLALIAACAAHAAAPHGMTLLTPAQREKVVEGVRLLREAERKINVDRGAWLETSLKAIEAIHSARGDIPISWTHVAEDVADELARSRRWDQAERVHGVLLRSLEGALPPGDCRIGGQRRLLADLRARRRLPKGLLLELEQAEALSDRVLKLYNAGRPDEALPLALRVLAAKRRILGDWSPAAARAWINVAAQHLALGRPARAEPLYRLAAEILQRARGRWHADALFPLDAVAVACLRRGNHAGRAAALLESAEVVRRNDGPAGRRVAMMQDAATSLASAGRPREALQAIRGALGAARAARADDAAVAKVLPRLARLAEELPGGAALWPALDAEARRLSAPLRALDPEEASRRVTALLTQGQDARADELAGRALEELRRLGRRRSTTSAMLLTFRGTLAANRGQREKAVAYTREALTIQGQVGGKKNREYVSMLVISVRMFALAGLHREALAAADEARGLLGAVSLLPGEKGMSAGILGNALVEIGENRRALPFLREANAGMAGFFGAGSREAAVSMTNLGVCLSTLGEMREAYTLLAEALRMQRRHLKPTDPELAAALQNLALWHEDMGDSGKALPLYREAAEVLERGGQTRTTAFARVLNNYAHTCHKQGDHEQSVRLYTRAAALLAELLPAGHPEQTTNQNSLASVYVSMGRYAQARLLLLDGIARLEKAGIRHGDAYAYALHSLAGVYRRTGEMREAVRLSERAIKLLEEAGQDRDAEFCETLHQHALVCLGVGRRAEALAAAERCARLARQQLEAAAAVQSERQQLTWMNHIGKHFQLRLSLPCPDGTAGELAYGHLLEWKGAAFARQLRQRGLTQLKVRAGDDKARALLTRYDEAVRRLAAVSHAPRPARDELAELVREKERLEGELSALGVTLAGTPLARPDPGAVRAALPEGAALVDYITYRHRTPAASEWGGGHRLVAFVVRKGRPAARIDLGPKGPLQALVYAWRRDVGDRRLAAAVHRCLWLPLAAHLDGCRAVLVSPDSLTALVPFAALPGRRAGTYLLEDVSLTYVPVPRLLGQGAKREAAPASMLLVGGVDFGPGEFWGQLPATRPEIAAAGTRFLKRFPDGGVRRLEGAAATAAAVRERLPASRFVHLATHAFFSPGKGVPPEAGMASGLVLAGANKPRAGHTGLLLAGEIAGLDLTGLELAVLSACETGLGEGSVAEGLLGLQRSFAVAGCKSVVSSLWSVDDAATAVLMERFYLHLWDRKLPKAEALRRAQLDVLRHPDWVLDKLRLLRRELAPSGADKLLRGAGRVPEGLAGPGGGRLSPPSWWAAFVLSGDGG